MEPSAARTGTRFSSTFPYAYMDDNLCSSVLDNIIELLEAFRKFNRLQATNPVREQLYLATRRAGARSSAAKPESVLLPSF
jgi:hypothetical protein